MTYPYDYNQGIPAANNNPSADQPNMLENTNSIYGLIGVDHINFGMTNAGAHKWTELQNIPGSSPPTLPYGAGFETLYSQVNTTESPSQGEIYFTRGGSGTGIQLTGPGSPVSAGVGVTFLPGGLRLQWGKVITSLGLPSSGTTNFYTSFTSAVYGVQITPICVAGGTSSSRTLYIKTTTISQFTWEINNTSSDVIGFYWQAVGN
jgi:hypothetical protein